MGKLWREGGSVAVMHHGSCQRCITGAVKRVEKNECGFRYSLVVGGRCLGKISKMQAIVGTHTVALAVSNYNNQQLQ